MDSRDSCGRRERKGKNERGTRRINLCLLFFAVGFTFVLCLLFLVFCTSLFLFYFFFYFLNLCSTRRCCPRRSVSALRGRRGSAEDSSRSSTAPRCCTTRARSSLWAACLRPSRAPPALPLALLRLLFWVGFDLTGEMLLRTC